MNISCTNCFEPYDTKVENEHQHPQTFCANHHVFCQRCCSLLKDCPNCKSKQILTTHIEQLDSKTEVDSAEKTEEKIYTSPKQGNPMS